MRSKIRIISGGHSEYKIVHGTCDKPLIPFAAHEMQRYLQKITKTRIAVNIVEELSGKNCVMLLHANERACDVYQRANLDNDSLSEDSFVIATVGRSLILGGTYRGVLYSVYAFLEKIGCRWYTPGPNGEFVPQKNTVLIKPMHCKEIPSFRRRGFEEDASHVYEQPIWEKAQLKDDYFLLDWLAKNRMNHCCRISEGLIHHAKRRGFMLSAAYGETLITRLLPRNLYSEHPNYFREDASGQRVRNGNMCVSNPRAIEVVVNNAIAYARQHPELFSVRISTQDIWGGGWCHCENCRKLSPQEQYLIVTNAIAKAWDQAGIQLRALNVPYHDTLAADMGIKPNKMTLYEFHPRERCYAHSIDDERCDRNSWYRLNFERWINSVNEAEVDILGYYGDCILFNSFPVLLTKVISKDLAYYKKTTGGTGVSFLLMGRYCWWAYPLNMYLFTKLSWNVGMEPSALIDDYLEKLYGGAAHSMKRFLIKFEDATSKLVKHVEPVMDAPQTYDPLIEKLTQGIKESLMLLDECASILDSAEGQSPSWRVTNRIRDDRLMLGFTRIQAASLLHYIQGLYWLNLAEHEDIVRGSLVGPKVKVPIQEKYFGEMWSEVPSTYDQAKRELEEAAGEYKAAIDFVESLPKRLQSSWLASKFGYRFFSLRLINILQMTIGRCEEGIRKSQSRTEKVNIV